MRNRPHQIRRSLTDGEGSDDHADGEAALGSKPGRDHLHRWRIDAGQTKPGQEPEYQRALEPRRGENSSVRDRAEKRRGAEKSTGRNEIGEVQHRRRCGAAHETQLHDGGEPTRLAGAEAPDRP